MLYFVPAWHQPDSWSENEQYWYVRREHTEFDDTVKQVQLFHRNGNYPYRIILLSFAPNFRHFLHRQGVYHAAYWSCFDAMLEITRTKAAFFSYKDMKWPEDCEFLYTNFAMVVERKGERFARIDFGEDGNLIQVDTYKDGRILRRNIYDDRGFVTGSILYRDGQPVSQDYMNGKGSWKLRVFFDDGHVEVNPKLPNYRLAEGDREEYRPYKALRYDSLGDMVAEVFEAYVGFIEKDEAAIYCLAADGFYAPVEQKALKGQRIILSFFENRCGDLKEEHMRALIKDASYLIADSSDNLKLLKRSIKSQYARFKEITPYDTRTDSGISQQLRVQKILVPIDGVSDEEYGKLLGEIAPYLAGNPNAVVHLFSRRADYWLKRDWMAKTRDILGRLGYDTRWAADEDNQQNVAEVNPDGEEVRRRFFVEQCIDEMSVNRCLREQRIMVDIRKQAELYLQITALSVGIPQIVRARTNYVVDGMNGAVIKDVKEVRPYLVKYLDELKEWNRAKVHSYEISQMYSTKVLLDMWEEVIGSIERD